MTSAPRPDVVIRVPGPVADTLTRLTAAVGEVVLVGGWAVQCRLKMARRETRPTSDVDVILGPDSRPARAALAAVSAVQDDPNHPCRLSGLPLLVDLPADRPDSALATASPCPLDATVGDPDGLRLLVPPFAALLARTVERVRLEGDTSEAIVGLPLAGALLAAKVGNISLEFRPAEKLASDGEDVVRLVEAFGALAIAHDLRDAHADKVHDVAGQLDQIGASALAAQSRASGYAPDVDRLRVAVDELVRTLRR